jgi:hypothetical protein
MNQLPIRSLGLCNTLQTIKDLETAATHKLQDLKGEFLGRDVIGVDPRRRKTEPYRQLSVSDKQQYRNAALDVRDYLNDMLMWMDHLDAETVRERRGVQGVPIFFKR